MRKTVTGEGGGGEIEKQTDRDWEAGGEIEREREEGATVSKLSRL